MGMMFRLSKRNFISFMNKKGVNTWSQLATAFNSKEPLDLNLFAEKECGLFGIPELKNAEGFDTLKREAIAKSQNLIAEATSSDRRRKMVEVFDELSDTLCKVADLAEFIRIAHPNQKYAAAAEDACIAISNVVEELNTHQELYKALSRVVNSKKDVQQTTEVDNHVSKLFLFDFEQSGIHLPERERQKVVQLNDHILQIGQRFMSRAVGPRAISADLVPQNISQYFNKTANNEIIVEDLYVDSSNDTVREAAYKIYLYPDDEQEHLLKELLNMRHQLAKTCGFPSYAHRAVRGSTAETPENIKEFLETLGTNLRYQADEDFRIMQKMKDSEVSLNQKLMAWDVPYFTFKAKKDWLGCPSKDFTPYFSLGTCMEGLSALTQALYGIRLEPEPVLRGEVWTKGVHKLSVIDEREGTLGHIYCDFYERSGKVHQACHFTIRAGRRLPDGSYQNPIVVLMLSFPAPQQGRPCLLSPSSVDNLFHEMGHALHSMLGKTQYQHVHGTRCATDFAEVPSVLMEYFASDPRVVKVFAKHYETQEPMPEQMLQKLCASKCIFSAADLQYQLSFSMLDQVYHSGEVQCSTTSILKDIQNKYYGMPYVENTAWQLRFSHLVNYGAKYYSYLISRAIASWIWQAHFQQDPFSRTMGESYRRECLSHGGGKPPLNLLADYLNKDVNPANFAKSLLSEIDLRKEQLQALEAIK